MKRVFQHPAVTPNPAGRKYWRSVGELHDTPEFRGWLEREFPAGAAEMGGDDLSRRNFLTLMGASLALAGFGLSGCRRPETYLVPYTKAVEWTIPGKNVLYATSMPRRSGAMPLVATTTEGRPIKLEGNSLHPLSSGGTDTIAQCSLLDLYDPDRSRYFLENGKPVDVARFAQFMAETRLALQKTGGAGAAILVEETFSPTRDRLRTALAKEFPQLLWCVYDPLRPFNEVEATRAAFGDGVRLTPRYDRADVVLSLDCDFLHVDEGGLAATRDFSNKRRVAQATDPMNRLYVVENRYTITGGKADHRLRLQASQIGAFAVALGHKVAAMAGGAGGALTGLLGAFPADLATRFAAQDAWLTEAARDLLANPGRSLVVVGRRQPGAVHLLAQAINGVLGNVGHTLVAHAAEARGGAEPTSISALAEAIDAKKIQTLFIFGGNPVYDALANLDWAEKQKSVPTVVRLGYYEDETSEFARWHVPMAHYLEQWGDTRTADGTYCVIQPMILPLFGGLSDLQVMSELLGQPMHDKPDLVRDTFHEIGHQVAGFPTDEPLAWNAFLRDGFLPGTATPDMDSQFNVGAAAAYLKTSAPLQFPAPVAEGDVEVVLIDSYQMDDGRYANNGWLQEMPHPITKQSWDNALLVNAATAKKLGLKLADFNEGDYSADNSVLGNRNNMAEIAVDGTTVRAAVLLSPGHADNSVSIALGYGRRRVGRVGRNSGFNVYPLRTAKNLYFITNAKVSPVAENYQLVITQEHQAMEGRNLVRELPIQTYRENAGFGYQGGRSFVEMIGMDAHIPPNVSLYRNPAYTSEHQWGMAIDLNTCTGCNACVVACQAENNIPVVGKDQVGGGRAMHRIRIDRYYSTIEDNNPDHDPTHDEDPQLLTQPVTCHQCENAPCETVCPVNATIHTEEGLNAMAYNRCIGTRYCSNNCPYKVRRFNFFNYNDRSNEPIESGPWKGKSQAYLGPFGHNGMDESLKLVKNPNVTVRMRGVMEKCTFCVQRIEEAKITQLQVARDSANKLVPRDSFTTACAQACPAGAIVFGNVADAGSKVSRVKAQDRDYKMLEYLDVRPRLSYQARLRNPNPRMPGASAIGNTLLGNPTNVPPADTREAAKSA
jgi:molybdopterin-containing oxidoreductase family iron-sulfur binding subunit